MILVAKLVKFLTVFYQYFKMKDFYKNIFLIA